MSAGPGVAVDAAGAGVAPATLLVAGRNLRRFFRSRLNVLSVLLMPILLMFVQLALAGKAVSATVGISYVDRLAPGVVLLTVAFGAAITAMGMYNDVRSGLLNRVRTLPVSPFALLAGRIIGDVTRVLATTAVTVAVAYVPGFRFSQGPVAALGFFGVVVLFAVMTTSLGLVAGLVFGSVETIRLAVSSPVVPVFLLSSGYVPIEAFPAFLVPVVQVNPISSTTTVLLGLSHGGPVAAAVVTTVAWVVVVTSCCLPIAIRRFRRLAVV